MHKKNTETIDQSTAMDTPFFLLEMQRERKAPVLGWLMDYSQKTFMEL